MQMLEKYRDHSLISKVMAIYLFFYSGASVLTRLISFARSSISLNSVGILFSSVIYLLPYVIMGCIFLLNKHDDKMFRYVFGGALIAAELIQVIRALIGSEFYDMRYMYMITGLEVYRIPVMYYITSIMEFMFCSGIAIYYMGFIKPQGRNLFLIVFYSMMLIGGVITIFSYYSLPVGKFACCALLTMYGYKERRCGNSTPVYIGMIGLAFYLVYNTIVALTGIVGLFMPSFFRSINLIACLCIPLLVYDRSVPGEEKAIKISFLDALDKPKMSQPAQQSGFDPMTGQPIQPAQQMPRNGAQPGGFPQQTASVQQGGFDPMTGQPIQPAQQMFQNGAQPGGFPQQTASVQQGGFDPMTGQPIQPAQQMPRNGAQPGAFPQQTAPVQQGGFDPMTGQPINNGNNNIPQ